MSSTREYVQYQRICPVPENMSCTREYVTIRKFEYQRVCRMYKNQSMLEFQRICYAMSMISYVLIIEVYHRRTTFILLHFPLSRSSPFSFFFFLILLLSFSLSLHLHIISHLCLQISRQLQTNRKVIQPGINRAAFLLHEQLQVAQQSIERQGEGLNKFTLFQLRFRVNVSLVS